MSDEVGHAELAAAEFSPKNVGGAYILHRPTEDATDGGGGGVVWQWRLGGGEDVECAVGWGVV